MIAYTHQNFGFLCGLGAILLLQPTYIAPTGMIEAVIFFLVVLVGSIFPDIDKFRSKIGRKLWFISIFMSILFTHRGFTHSLLFLAIMGSGTEWLIGITLTIINVAAFYSIYMS